MNDESSGRLREVFEAAAELPPDQRGAYLESACAGDASLRAEVEELLRRDAVADHAFLESPIPRASAGLPVRIGRYRVTGRLGTGGMGVVYEGAQESPSRAVAIKVIRSGMLSEHLIARFRNEAEILGRLDHPGIARIYEAGTTTLEDSGDECPFFAMELVRGTPLLEFTAGRPIGERLHLFAEICDAVHHAHQKGVIHRDLKPANILVTTMNGGESQAKILDFGVARATNADIQVVTLQTDVGQLLGTVPYMSPEQVTGDLGRLDTRSDVYSLGVVLFELLTGALPHDVRERSVVEAARIIRDEESTRLSTVMPGLRGDLEWIVAKALEKDVERRYDSASALAAEVRRHLADEPVLAGPPRASYRLRKFVRRNKVGVGWAGAAAILLVAGVAATVSQTVRATRAEQEVRTAAQSLQREADRGRLSSDFLVLALASAAPEDAAEVRRTVDASAARIDDLFGSNRQAEINVRRLMGDVYTQFGAYEAAQPHLQRAYDLMSATPDRDPFSRAGLIGVMSQLNIGVRELGGDESESARWYFEILDELEVAADAHAPALAAAMRDMRASIILPDAAPRFAVQDDHLDRVMSAWARIPSRETFGIETVLYLIYVDTYLIYTFDNHRNTAYARACVEILDGLDQTLQRDRIRSVALWHELRVRAEPGGEQRRVEVAERLIEEGVYGWVGWPVHDSVGLLGDALVQRGREEDRADIALRLTTGHRGLRELATPDAAAHGLLEQRRGTSLVRLAAVGHDERVVHLVDQPEILDELARGVAVMTLPSVLDTIAQSMSSREGLSDRWYEVAAGAAARAAELREGLTGTAPPRPRSAPRDP